MALEFSRDDRVDEGGEGRVHETLPPVHYGNTRLDYAPYKHVEVR